MLSYWHVHAWDYTKELMARDDVKITAVWDEIPERGEKAAKEIGAAFEADLDALLKRDDVDGVVIDTPTNLHRGVMIAAAEAGKHIFTEKVMALTVKDCQEIADAVRKAGVKFCISFPHRTMPHNLFAKKVVDEKLIGDVTLLRVRNAHNGSVAGWLPDHFYDPVECGGGAMVDLGAHGMYLSRWLLGEPTRITSMFNNYIDKPVEDNAVSVIEFENKAIAINETGFVTSNSPFSLELHGTQGSLFIGGPENKVRLISSKIESQVAGWITPTQLPDSLPSAVDQWVNGILKDEEIIFGLDEGIELTELMEGAYISHRENRIVEL